MSIGISAGQVAIMFMLMALGWIAYRLKWIGDDAVKGMTKLLLFFVTPAVILQAFLRPFDPARLQTIGLVFVLDIAVFVIMIGISALLFSRRLIPDRARRTALKYGTTYSNAGFLGIPLAQALLGDDGVFYVVAFVVTFQIFVWTHGDGLFGGGRLGARGSRLVEVLLNPNIIATAAGLVCFVLSVRPPALVAEAMGHVASMNTPFSMMVVGANLAVIGVRSVFRDRYAWLGTAARNLLVPTLFVVAFALLPIDPVAKSATLIAISAPVGAFLVMFAIMHESEPSFPTRLLTLSTLSAIVTMPAVLWLSSVVW